MADVRKTDGSPGLTWRGDELTPERIVKFFTRGAEDRLLNSRKRILACRDFRRGTLAVGLSDAFVNANPEVAGWAVSKLEGRETIERDLIAKAGASEPHFSRTALDTTDTAQRQAEEFESHQNEIFKKCVPYPEYIEKGTEDGEFGWVTLPAELDYDGMPDFYDRLDERAYAALDDDDEKKGEYTKDEDDRKGRYVRRDKDGNKKPNPAYSRDSKKKHPEKPEDRDDAKSDEAYDEAVRRYLLTRDASTTRKIPALDCVPLLVRGKHRRPWDVPAIVERTLFEPEDLERNYGWACMGDKLVVPSGVKNEDTGKNGQFYLYALYFTSRDDAGHERPCIAYTVGGASTQWSNLGVQGDADVAIIDLYHEYGLEGSYWGYEHALHTADDDPDFYGRPYLWSFLNRMLNIEGLLTANQAATGVNAYGGYYHRLDGSVLEALERMDPAAVVDSATHVLRKPVVPGPGQIETVTGDVIPAQQARIGPDAWRMLDVHMEALREATMIDQAPTKGASGYAMMTAESLGQVAKRHIREAALRAAEDNLACDAKIRHAVFRRKKVRWPIHTTKEKPVGTDTVNHDTWAEWDPDWVGEGNFHCTGEFSQEFNLARADLELNAYLKGVRGLKHVAAAFGESDVMALRTELAKDAIWNEPESKVFMRSLVMRLRGMERQEKAMQLQQDGQLGRRGVPGAEMGVPTALTRRAEGGQQQPMGPGRPSIASSVRGGVQGAELGGAEMAANALGQLGAA